MIQGKILRIMDKKLQIENYGFVSLDAEFCVYHLKSDGIVTPGEVSELSVGESEAKYVAASGKSARYCFMRGRKRQQKFV